VNFERAFSVFDSYEALTRHAVSMATEVGEPYGALLELLKDCYEASEAANDVLGRQQNVGATYKSLAFAAHRSGMSTTERVRWYRIAESIPLSQRHIGHILSRMVQQAA